MDNVLDFMNKCSIQDDIDQVNSDIEPEEFDVIFNEDKELDLDADYQYTRRKLINTIQLSEAILNRSVKQLKDDCSARMIEATSSLIKTINETHDRLFSVHEKMRKIKPKEESKTKESDKKTTIKATINDIIDQMD